MRKYFKNITKPFLIVFTLLFSALSLAQTTYDPVNQNRDWDVDATQSTVFFKTPGTNLEITPNLMMLVFKERGGTATLGGSWVNTTDPNGDNYYSNHSNTIPNGWTYEISDSQGSASSNNVTVSTDKKKITFSGEAPQDLTIYLNVIDANGNTIDALGSVQLDLYVRGNFTISNQEWSACLQQYIIEVNEITVNNTKPCRPYRIIVYNRTVDTNGTGTIDTSTVVYDSNNDSNHDPDSNVWNLSLDVGKYSAIITNSCGERYNGENGYYDFEISNVYAFGASVVFAGFQCLDDAAGTAIVKIEGAAIPMQEWKLTNKATGAVITTATYNSNGTTASSQGSFSFQNFEPSNFSTQNFTVTIPDLPTDTYIFYFKDKNGCEDSVEFEVKKPEAIDKDLITSESKTALDCHGDSDGKLTFIGSGGWTEPWSGNTVNPNGWGASYTFKLLDANGNEVKNQTGNRAFGDSGQIGYKTSFTGLTAGLYTLVISENITTNPFDSNILYVCSKTFTETFEITQPPPIVATATPSDYNGFGVKCKGDENGTIELDVSGGTAPYTYVWKKDGTIINNVTTQNLSDLGVGTYSVTITDANNCTKTVSTEITEPVELTIADAGLSTTILCYDDNGQIKVNITGDSNGPSSSNTNGGTSRVYTYTLTGTDYNNNTVNTSVNITDLTKTFAVKAGTYKVKVTDVNGCFKETADITLTQPSSPLSLSLSDTDITCFGLTNGSISASVSGGTANYTYAWTKDGTTIANQTSANLSNLGPGTYAVTVTDANGCTTNDSVVISQPDQLVVNSITTSNKNGYGISCNGAADGSISASVSGGTANYTYAWTKDGTTIANQTSANLSNLGPGTYAVTVTDANSCTTTASTEITEPVALTIANEGLSTAIACHGDNGQIQINITGDSNGTAGTNQNYTYTLTGTDYSGATVSQSFQTNALNHTFAPKAGTYTVKVTDPNDCEDEITGITLTQPSSPLSLSLSDTDITCFGLTNGSISASVSGGTANYTYAWTKDGTTIANQTSANLSNLGPGTYAVTVTDANGCTTNDSVVISQPDDLVISENITNFEGFEVSCFGADDAAIDITVTGGTPNYTYQWSTSDGGVGLKVNEPDQSGLSPGTYKVLVTDANGCTEEKTYVIEEPDQLSSGSNVPTTNGFAISCNGENDGAINITPSGGTGVYSYNWSSNVSNSGIIQGQQNQSGLKPGVYSVIISDSNQCPTTLNFTLTEPNAINASATLSNYNGFQISSKGAQDGSINLDVSGGHLNNGEDYTYSWSSNITNSGLVQGEKDQIGLKAGVYTVTITDSNQCSITREYTLNEPASLSLSLDLSLFGSFNIKCYGDDNGSIDLTINGGSGSNTIVWTTSDGGTGLVQRQEDQTGLGPGTYTVSVTDSNGANAAKTVQITEPTILEVNHSIPLFNGFAISCSGGNNGSIDVSTTGGTGNYTFNWSTNDGGGLVNGLEDQSGLEAGTYLLTVTDSNGCSQTKSYILDDPDPINISATLSDYNGFEVSGAGQSDGEIDITVVGGIEAHSYQWSTSDGVGLDINAEDQTGLTAGTYTVLVTDQNGCTETKVYKLSEPAQIAFDSSVSLFTGNFNISCKGANDGSIDIIPSGGSGTYTYIWSTSDGSGLVQGEQDQSGLGPGTYALTLRDSNGYETSQNFTLTEPDEVIISQSSVSDYNNFDVSCFGGLDGEINITMSGGTGVYTYTWTTSNGSGLTAGQEDQSGLSVGTYSVSISDENGCTVSQSFTLTSPPELAIISTKKDYNGFNVSCNGLSEGEIDIEVSGGYLDPGAAYSYSWTTNNGSGLDTNAEDQTGLSAGSYTVTATDDNGCTITETIIVTEPDDLNIDEVISNYSGFEISQAGENDGSIDITVTGGTSNYSYVWSTLDGSGLVTNSEDQTGLTAGTYTVVVTDTNGCEITEDYTLREPKELLINIDHDAYKNDVLCYGDATASIKVDITQGSIAPYTYSINGTTYLNENYTQSFDNISDLTFTFTNLTAGEYSITITDANGATKTSPLKDIRGPDNPLDISGETTNITCHGAADGTIDVTVTGGGGSSNQFTYFYSWTTLDGSGLDPTAQDQTGLGPGTYTVVVTDINDCSITESYTITQSPPLTYNLDSTKNITCNGDNDGEINITVTGGTGNYSYEWLTENGSGIQQGEQDQSGLGPGDYKLILRDGCNTFEYLYTIITPDVLDINLDEKVNILCHDASTGAIGVTVSGGTLPYNYVWKDNFGNVYDRNVGNVFNDGDLSNIPAGIYDLTVTDANGCVTTFSTELTQPDDLIIDIQKTDLNCYNSNNGTITITPTGGVAPYSYTWSDFGNGNQRTGLSAGTYTVTINDSNGCSEIRTVEIENAELFDVNPTVTPVSCFRANDGSIEMNFEGGAAPISFTWSDDSTAGQNRYNLSPGIYSVLITDASGCEIQRDFTIIEPKEISLTGVLTDALDCDDPASGSIDLQVSGGNAPYTFIWSNGETSEDISGLIANNYLVKVTDSKGCTSEKEFVINRQDDLEINLDTNYYAVCETREVYQKNIVSVSGGVAPYTIEWSNGLVSGNNNEIMDTKIEGSYQVTVTDFLGCSESIVFQVETPEIGLPDFDYTSFYLNTFNALSINDPITFTNLSTEDYFNVHWDFGDGNTSKDINAIHTYTKRGVYDVTLTVEFILGCSYSITKQIYVGDSYEIVIPNAFTPNSDGYNDTFRPVYYGFTNIILQVFDTWGNLIYSEEATTNKLNGWDGKINGSDAENGNYFYQVSGVAFSEDLFTKNGSFTLIK